MNNILSIIAALVIGFSAMPAYAGSHANPCNPCAIKKPVNPCAMNPCATKEQVNACAINPRSMKAPANLVR